MRLSAQARREALEFSHNNDFARLQKELLAEDQDAEQATKRYTDFIQMVHELAGHPMKKQRAMEGDFLL